MDRFRKPGFSLPGASKNPPSGKLGVPAASPSGGRSKVALQPGHSALDWHDLNSKVHHNELVQTVMNELEDQEFLRINNPASIEQLRQNVPCYKIRPFLNVDEYILEKHDQRGDFWCVIRGKVYCLDKYLEYHPGGVEILVAMSCGRDTTRQFDRYHRWVNVDKLLEKCFIGMYIG